MFTDKHGGLNVDRSEADELPPVRLTITFYALLFTTFLGLLSLKLYGLVDWSWWLITWPLWIGPIGQIAWRIYERRLPLWLKLTR